MKRFLTILLLTTTISTAGQSTAAVEIPIQTVERIFNSYVKYSEGVDSRSNEEAMARALGTLQQVSSEKDLFLLINVWMYYDPTDFSVRELIEPIFNKNKQVSLAAIDKRLKRKRKGENNKTAPYTDLIALKEKMSK
jgi:hypothetical protein